MDINTIIYALLAVLCIQSIGGLYIIYRLAILVKARSLYEAKEYLHDPEPEIDDQNNDTVEDLTPGIGPLTNEKFSHVRPTK